jgi:hypothetical protein
MPAPDHPLFTAQDLTDWLQKPIGDAQAAMCERVVWGWLKPILKLADRPAALTEEQAAWAIELGGIAASNPDALSRYVLEGEESFYDGTRRDEILRNAAAGGVTPAGGAPPPRGSFPPATCYPDPAYAFARGRPVR